MRFMRWQYRLRQLAIIFCLFIGSSGVFSVFAQEAQPVAPPPTPSVQAGPTPQSKLPVHEDEEFLELYKTLQAIIDAIAVDAVPTDKEFRYAAAKGLMRALKDPYAAFFTPEETTFLKEQMKGSFAGIGATLKPEDEGLLQIVELIENSPAQKAGLQKEDRIAAIDGVAVSEYAYLVAIMHIRGGAGTVVKLTVLRKGAQKPLELAITREMVILPDAHVTARLDGVIGIITIPQFGDDTTVEFFEAVGRLISQGAGEFIIDLRNNGGGKLDTAIEIASAWATSKLPVTRLKKKNGEETYFPNLLSTLLAGKKTAVLVNGASASASEILAGALRDWDAATLIGTATFGKGIAQSVIPFNDGSSVHITSAYWLTPNGERIHKKGIKPFLVVERTSEDEKVKKDPQMDRALEFLKTGK